MNLREKQKKETRREIINSAQEIFSEEKYEKATISEIAARSGVAEGTIYNYFSSKGEILITIFSQMFFQESYEFKEIHEQSDVESEIINFLDFYLNRLKSLDKALLREAFSLQLKYKHQDKQVFKTFDKMDQKIIGEIKTFLIRLKEKNILAQDTDIKNFVEVCYAVFRYNYSDFLMDPDKSYEIFFRELKEKIGYTVDSILLS